MEQLRATEPSFPTQGAVFGTFVQTRLAIEASMEQFMSGSVADAKAALDDAANKMNFSRAELGAREQSLDVLSQRLDDEEIELRDKLSLESEVDLVEAITQLTARQAALEAALRTLAQTANLSLLNFL